MIAASGMTLRLWASSDAGSIITEEKAKTAEENTLCQKQQLVMSKYLANADVVISGGLYSAGVAG
jgi:hypothetical protein